MLKVIPVHLQTPCCCDWTMLPNILCFAFLGLLRTLVLSVALSVISYAVCGIRFVEAAKSSKWLSVTEDKNTDCSYSVIFTCPRLCENGQFMAQTHSPTEEACNRPYPWHHATMSAFVRLLVLSTMSVFIFSSRILLICQNIINPDVHRGELSWRTFRGPVFPHYS